LDVNENWRYQSLFHNQQLEWLIRDLEKVETEKPISIITQIPMISVRSQVVGDGKPEM